MKIIFAKCWRRESEKRNVSEVVMYQVVTEYGADDFGGKIGMDLSQYVTEVEIPKAEKALALWHAYWLNSDTNRNQREVH